jgi:hypothetical protein
MALMKDISVGGDKIDIEDLTDEMLLSEIHSARADATANCLGDEFENVPKNMLPSMHRRSVLARDAQTSAKLKALQNEARRRKLQVD